MNFTSINQSKKLVELGIDPNTSDLWYSLDDEDPEYAVVNIEESPFEWEEITVFDRALPCWSTGALLNLLPKIIFDKYDYYEYNLFIDVISEMPYYILHNDCYLSDFPNDFLGGDLISNLIKCIEWLKENKYM